MSSSTGTFTGFQPEAIQFLIDLALNNERGWFQPRKAEYERLLKEPMESLVAVLVNRFRARGIPLEGDPQRAVFRIYRDTRFSKDKSPYKANIVASIPWAADEGAHGRLPALPARRDVRGRGHVPDGATAVGGISSDGRG